MKNEIEQAAQRFAADIVELVKANVLARLGAEPATSVPSVWAYSPLNEVGRFTSSTVTLTGSVPTKPSKAVVESARKTAHAMGLVPLPLTYLRSRPDGASLADVAKATKLGLSTAKYALGRLRDSGHAKVKGKTRGARWFATGVR